MPAAAPPEEAPAEAASPWTGEAAAGVDDERLASLLRDHWEWVMRSSPTWATELGDHRYDARIPDESYEAVQARRRERRAWLARAREIDPDALSARDRVTHALFVEDLESTIAEEVCETELWSLSAMHNPLTEWSYLPRLHRVETYDDGRNLVARYRAIPRAVDDEITRLRIGAERGLYTNAETTRRVIAMVRGQLDEPLEGSPMMAPAREERAGWTADERTTFASGIATAVRDGIRPALGRYADFLEAEILPRARDEARSGVGSLPFGEACYAARIRRYTGLPKTAEELHRTGLAELGRINGAMRELGGRLFGTGDLAEILARLRGDPSMYFDSPEAIEEKARAALAAARAKIPEYFGVLPQAECVVTRVPDYEAPFTTIAYYRPPHPDGSKPGEYFVNVTEPETRPRYGAEVLAYHEAIPGHHLQIAIAQEIEALPTFRRHMGLTAFVEGWALYAERLADEMGLYSGDLDRMGMLSYEAWRAARLVVDTGIHAMGWSREQAVQTMLAHTALAENNVRNEVDRYISWPGQALAYKVGQLEILRLRREAEERLGERFDVRAFHDVVLGGGAVSLPVLEARVTRWIAEREGA